MRKINFREALNEALQEEMRRDSAVFVMGEDVATPPGETRVNTGLREEFGADRVINTPISEGMITGTSAGAAIMGMRPVSEIRFADFLSTPLEAIFSVASRVSYVSDGEAKAPMVLRTCIGRGGMYRASVEAWYAHVPGVKVVIPSTPYDAKGLLKSAIRDDNPVIFFEHEDFYEDLIGPVPEEEYTIPLGVADIKREGSDATIVAIGTMVHEALAAAEELAGESINLEVVDLCSASPIDKTMILDSVRKTGRLIIAHHAWKTAGIGAEISAIVAEEAMPALKAPIIRVASLDVHAPFSYALQRHVLPSRENIINAVKDSLSSR